MSLRRLTSCGDESIRLRNLTLRQDEVLAWIEQYTEANGFPPSGREMSTGCHLGSASGAHRMIKILQAKGFIERADGASRSLTLREPAMDYSTLSDGDQIRLQTMGRMYRSLADIELSSAIGQEEAEHKERITCHALVLVRRAIVLSRDLPNVPEDLDLDPYLTDLRALRTTPAALTWSGFVIDHYITSWVFSRILASLCQDDGVRRAILWPDVRLYRAALRTGCKWLTELANSDENWCQKAHDRIGPLVSAIFEMTGGIDDAYGLGRLSVNRQVPVTQLRDDLERLPRKADMPA